jgi:glutamate dehydrogenase
MASALEERPSGTIDDVLAALESAPDAVTQPQIAENLRTFTRLLFADVKDADLHESDAAALAAIARDTFNLFAGRKARAASVRVTQQPTGPNGALRTLVQIVNDDMPFLVDSTLGEIVDRGYTLEWLTHPILHVRRSPDGGLIYLDQRPAQEPPAEEIHGAGLESVMVVQIDDIVSDAARSELEQVLRATLADVRAVVDDWQPMMTRLRSAIERYKTADPPVPEDERAESIAFLEWIFDRNFVRLQLSPRACAAGTGARPGFRSRYPAQH